MGYREEIPKENGLDIMALECDTIVYSLLRELEDEYRKISSPQKDTTYFICLEPGKEYAVSYDNKWGFGLEKIRVE